MLPIPPFRGTRFPTIDQIEKYQSNWIISPNRGENKKYLKPPHHPVFFDAPSSKIHKAQFGAEPHFADLLCLKLDLGVVGRSVTLNWPDNLTTRWAPENQ